MNDSLDRLKTALADRYAIEDELGAGGMATVYLAEDLKHKRKVALKVLKPELAAVLGHERFIQEITTTANLQHPHILPLFDSGEAEAFLYYVMPFIDGETLRDKLNRETQLGIDEAVKIATEVADALDYAHRNNVIHRDIKPENILLHDGRPMVADFGIALAVSAAAGGRMTETGMSLGTPHYMSPEQATADKDLSNRSDIYSLGAVLYEMLTGDPPHTGSSAQQIVMKIVTDQVRPVTELRKSVPSNVAAATAKALEKLAADRFGTAKEFAEALTNPAFALLTTHGTPSVGYARSGWNRLTAVFAALAAVFAIAFGWSIFSGEPEAPRPVARFHLGYQSSGGDLGPLSPDGSFHVFVAPGSDGRPQIWRRRWEDLEPTPVPGTEGATSIGAVSPDGREIAYSNELPGPLLVTSVDGGPARTLVEFQWGSSDWGADGMVYFTTSTAGGVGGPIGRVPAAGGPEEVVTEMAAGELAQGSIHLLPSGRALLFTVWYTAGGSDAEIWALDLESRERKRLTPGNKAAYASSGHLLFATLDGTLMAAPFEADGLEVTGPTVPVGEGVFVSPFLSIPFYELSASGALIYRTGADAPAVPVWIDRRNMTREVMSEWLGAVDPSISPDGGRLAVARGRDIFVVRLDGGPSTRLTFGEGRNSSPSWSPDGRTVLFLSDRGASVTGHNDVFATRADGSGEAELVLDAEESIFEAHWSPDKEWLIYTTGLEGPTSSDIWGVQPGANATPVALVTSRFVDVGPALSPDGRWLAYASEGGLYVAPFPNTGDARWIVSEGMSREPEWSSDGTELFYAVFGESLDSLTVYAAEVDTETDFSVVATQAISTHLVSDFFGEAYAVAPDGQRLLVVEGGAREEGELILVQNFVEELKAKVGRGGGG